MRSQINAPTAGNLTSHQPLTKMLATRIIPTILMKRRQLVKGEGFKSDRVIGDALQAARIHAMRQVDEILMLDVTATKEGREPDYEMIKQLTKTATVPVTIGGGITKLEHIEKLLRSGADKICIGEAWELIEPAANKHGSQCIVASVDADPIQWDIDLAWMHIADCRAQAGAGEILLQQKEIDGSMKGYDLDLINSIANYVDIPVIASSGCSGYPDMHEAIKAGASAVAAGALFAFTAATPRGAAEYLNEQGVEVRCD